MNVIVKSSRNAKVSVYHTRECAMVKKMNSRLETTKAKAEARGLRECDECRGENYGEGVEKDFSYYQAAKNAGD